MTVITVPTLGVKSLIQAQKAASLFCSPTPGGIWFPTVEGVTTLPPAPAVVNNPAPKPVNAAPVPEDFDENDLCRLFQDILPVSTAPVYEQELTVEYVFKPYNEKIPLYGVVRSTVSVESFPYKMNLGVREVSVLVKPIIFLAGYPQEVTIPLKLEISVEKIASNTRTYIYPVKIKFSVTGFLKFREPTYLLHMDGTVGSSEFIDETGNTTWESTYATYSDQNVKFGASSGDFTTSTSQIKCVNDLIDNATSNFLVDFWFYPFGTQTGSIQYLVSFGVTNVINQSNRDFGIYLSGINVRFAYQTSPTSSLSSILIGNLTANQWNYVYLSRSGGTVYYSLNFATLSSVGIGLATKAGSNTHIIANSYFNSYFDGYIDEFRFINDLGTNSPPVQQFDQYDPPSSIRFKVIKTRTYLEASLIFNVKINIVNINISPKITATTGFGFKPVYYLGNATARTISGIGFKPGLVIIADRANALTPLLFDTIRGVNRYISLSSFYSTETTQTGTLEEFLADGIRLGSNTLVNTNNRNYSAWIFKSSFSNYKTDASVAVQDGFIAQNTVNVNKREGFSYGEFVTNDTNVASNSSFRTWVYHGLGGEPDFVLAWGINNFDGLAFSKFLPPQTYINVNSTTEVALNNDDRPLYEYKSSRSDSFGVSSFIDGSAGRRVFFMAFKNTPGFVSHGKYVGNTDQSVFVETGFKPAFIMLRFLYGDSNGKSFVVYDAARGFNFERRLNANAEVNTGSKVTVQENGFTVLANTDFTTNDSVFMYLALAGTLVSPLTGTVAILEAPSVNIAVNKGLPRLALESSIRPPVATITVSASEVDQISAAPSVLIPSGSIQVTPGLPVIAPDITIDVDSLIVETKPGDVAALIQVSVRPGSGAIGVFANAPDIQISPQLNVGPVIVSVNVGKVNFLIDEVLTAEAGSYALTGYDADGLKGQTILADKLQIQADGQEVFLVKSSILTAEAGEQLVDGQDANFAIELPDQLVLQADAGSLAVAGQNAVLDQGVPIDPYFARVELLLSGEGLDDGTSIVDTSTRSRTVATNSGAVTSIDQYKFGSSSLYFDAVSTLSQRGFTYEIETSAEFGTGDYTIELFFRLNQASRLGYLFCIGTFSGFLLVDSSDNIRWLNTVFTPATPLTANTWYHLAAVRNSGNVKVFLDGTQIGSTLANTRDHTTNTWWVGRDFDFDRGLYGYIDELRVTKGIARYDSNFTAPTAPYLLGLPRLVGKAINSDSTADTSAVVTVPTHQQGDLLVVVLMWRDDRGALTVPNGWTLQGTYTDQIVFSGVTQELLVYTKTASASEPASYTWSASNSTRNAWLSIAVRNAEIEGVVESYGNATTATIGTVANRLNLSVFTWVYAATSGTESYSQASVDLSSAEISDSPKAQARLSGGYTYSATTLTSTHLTATDTGSPNHGGINIRFKYVAPAPINNYSLSAATGGFNVSGSSANLNASKRLEAAAGSVALSGQDSTLTATFINNYTLTAESGTVSIAGQDVNLIAPAAFFSDWSAQVYGFESEFYPDWWAD